MKKEYRNLIFLFLFAFVVRIILLFTIQVKYWDETVYLSLAKDLAHNFFNYSLNGAFWSDYIPFGQGMYHWPNIGFRAPFLPVTLSFLYRFKLSFLIDFFIPLVAAASSVLVYFLGKKIFNEKVGWYSALLFSIIPINLLWGFRISTGIYGCFFLLLSLFFFWKGFEEEDNLSKILFGVFLAISILTRYTLMWIIPIFLIYFLIRDKNIKILKDKYLWFSILGFFAVLLPWFVHGVLFYHNPLGSFIHGTIGSSFWGGTQSLLFYFRNFWRIFSMVGIIFLFSLVYLIKSKNYKKNKVFFFLVFFFFFLLVASFVPHKEERFILPLIIPVSFLGGFFIDGLEKKFNLSKRKGFFIKFFSFFLIFLIAFVPLFMKLNSEENTGTQVCFEKGIDYISSLNDSVLIYSDEPPIVYSYTNQEIRYYPNPWNNQSLERGENVYVIYTDYDKPLYLEENVLFREDLKENFEEVFSCDKDWGITEIYRVEN